MSASSVIYINAVDAALAAKAEALRAKKRAKQAAPRRWFSFRPRRPTTFQRCLALHLVGAERYSALD